MSAYFNEKEAFEMIASIEILWEIFAIKRIRKRDQELERDKVSREVFL